MIDDQPTANASRKDPDGSWNPVIMSVVVFPGIGQWMQKRHVSGSIYAIIFALMGTLFSMVLYKYVKGLIPIFQQALQGQVIESAEIPPLKIVIQPFAIVIFIYFANVVDVLRGRLQVIQHLKSGKPD